MRNQSEQTSSTKGVALVIVLGLLAILTILAVAFSSAMLVERLAAWNHANSVRAQALMQTALVKAMSDVRQRMLGGVYPCFTNSGARKYDAMGSSNGFAVKLTNLLSGEALALISLSLQADAKAAGANCYWIPIVESGRTNGRVAYIVVNDSGLIDINYAGGQYRNWSTNLAEIDCGNLFNGAGLSSFTNQRIKDRRYETMTEAMALNPGVVRNPHDGFSAFSFDLARDKYFPMSTCTDIVAITTLGRPDVKLANKFNINAITNYVGWTNSWDYYAFANDDGPNGFMVNYYEPLVEILSTVRSIGGTMVERPKDVAWNIVNYLDPDRIPSVAKDVKPWNSTEGSEALPLINEIVLKPFTNATYPSNAYEFAVELWYPFAPTTVVPADKMFLWVGVYTNPIASGAVDDFSITNCSYVATNYTFTGSISNMSFGGVDFLVYTSPANKKIRFPVSVYVTNPTPGYVTNYLPIGSQTYTNATGVVFKVENCVWFLARVYKQENIGTGNTTNIILDEAMGYGNTGSEPFAGDPANENSRHMKCFTNTMGYSVNDPRSNGRVKYWLSGAVSGDGTNGPIGGVNYRWDSSSQTLGTTNVNCDAWSKKGSGLPIYFTNGPMENIGELGYIFRGNLDDEQGAGYKWWRTINLMHFDEGAALLDRCTVRSTNASAYGLFNINSRQTNSWKALFNNIKIGWVSGPETNFVTLDSSSGGDLDKLVQTIINNGPYLNFRSMFTSNDADNGGGGPVAAAFRFAATNNHPNAMSDIFMEDPFRRICELITFRQNLFTVIMAAQVFGGDGESVVGEKRAMAVIYRDSYTGRYFIRSFKWLSD